LLKKLDLLGYCFILSQDYEVIVTQLCTIYTSCVLFGSIKFSRSANSGIV
jgi:hypothetical protein